MDGMAGTKQVLDEATAAFNAHDEERIRGFYVDASVFEASTRSRC